MDRVSNCTAGHGIIIDPVPKNTTSPSHNKLKVVFFSSAPIGISFLEELHNDKDFEIIWVVTQPDQSSGRGMKMKANIIKTKALELLGAKATSLIQTPHTLKLRSKQYPWEGQEFYNWIKDIHPDYLVVIAYWKIIPQTILDIPTIAPINIHGSLLPHYRGASPIQTALLNGDKETGITIMKMSAGLDEGDSIAQLPITLDPTVTTLKLIDLFIEKGPQFTVDTLKKYHQGGLKTSPQDNSKATFTYKITKEQWEINPFTESLDEVVRKYNAYYLRPKIYFYHNNKRFIIEEPTNWDLKNYKDHKDESHAVDKKYNLNPAAQDMMIKAEWKKSIHREEWKKGYVK
jgi:methionyl-tRNA formyltransferase